MEREDDELKLKGDKKIPFMELLKRNLIYLKPEWKSFTLSLALIVITVFFDIILPLILSDICDILCSDNPDTKRVIFLLVVHLGLGIFNQVILIIESMILQYAGQRIIYRLRMEVFTHIENMSQNQINTMPVGSLVTRVASYTASMSDLFTNVIVNVLRNALTVVGVFVIMIVLSLGYNRGYILTLTLFIIAIVIFVVSYFFGKIVGKIFRKERKYISDLNTFLNENLSGMKITQMFNQESRKEEEFLVKNENLRKTRFGITSAFGIYRPFISFLYFVAIAAIFYMGIKFELSVKDIIAFYMYLSKFFNPIQNLADQLNNLQQSFTASERLFNLLDVKPEVLDKENALEIETFKGKIEFKNVWFAYNKDEWILKDVSFVINPKETAAFVGATGAGKTTILSLIVRNYEIQKGQILIDDIDISNIKISCLRKAIGQMLQDVFIFTGTVKSNITLKDDKFTDEEVWETCKYVNADYFINKLDDGLNQKVIERGENFSQGERQLLSFARTVVHKPQILILDEATSNIDTETEKIIQDSLERIKNIGTMLVVAHRLSTIQHADQIIVLQHGEVIERGTHQDLLKNRGYYYKLYELQYKDQESI